MVNTRERTEGRMSRYVEGRAIGGRLWVEDDVWADDTCRSIDVYTANSEGSAVNTGILSAAGIPLWRLPTPRQIGFRPRDL